MKRRRIVIGILLLALLAALGVWRLLPRPAAEPSAVCTLSIRCDTLLAHRDELDSAVAAIIPEDGVLMAAEEVALTPGESVFDVLLRETRARGIALEFTETPLYGAVYIEGIGNLYEFDCGALSGWMYRVDGAFPNYGSSACALSGEETVEWVYTCDLGADVGNVYGLQK